MTDPVNLNATAAPPTPPANPTPPPQADVDALQAQLNPAAPGAAATAPASPASPLLNEPLPDPNRDFRREPLTPREFSVIQAHQSAGAPVPDYPPPEADLGATDYSTPQARESVLASLRSLGWNNISEDDLDWQSMQVRANSHRRLAEDHNGQTVLQYKSPGGGWQNAGDIRGYDGLGGIYRPSLQGSSGGDIMIFGPHADQDQIQEILDNNWIPSYFDGSQFYPHERPTYNDDGTLTLGRRSRPALLRRAGHPAR